MLDFLRTTPAKAVIVTAVVAILAMVGYYVVRRFRDSGDDDVPTANEILTNFRELHDKGDINEEEFRTIKTALKGKLEEELNDTGDEG